MDKIDAAFLNRVWGRRKRALFRVLPIALEGLVEDKWLQLLRVLTEVSYIRSVSELDDDDLDDLNNLISWS